MEEVASPLGEYRPLKGLSVVELASVLAGPLVGTFLAELGADVIKVEHPGTGGDVTRQWRTEGESATGPSAYYAAANGPKKLVQLDLAHPEGRADLEALLTKADFLLQNFKASSLQRLGLSPASLASRHPHLIHLHLQGFMADPNRPGYDMVVQAETGLMALNGEPGRAPFRMPVAMMDILAAHQMRSAALLALWERERHGLGSFIEVWLDAAGLSALANRGTEHLVAGQEPAPLGAAHPQIAPYGESFSCACGGSVVLAVGNDRQFSALCAALNQPTWAHDPRFATNPERVHNRAVLADYLTREIVRHSLDSMMDIGREFGIPMGRLMRVSEALNGQTGMAMTANFESEGHALSHVRQAAFRVQRNGSFNT